MEEKQVSNAQPAAASVPGAAPAPASKITLEPIVVPSLTRGWTEEYKLHLPRTILDDILEAMAGS